MTGEILSNKPRAFNKETNSLATAEIQRTERTKPIRTNTYKVKDHNKSIQPQYLKDQLEIRMRSKTILPAKKAKRKGAPNEEQSNQYLFQTSS